MGFALQSFPLKRSALSSSNKTPAAPASFKPAQVQPKGTTRFTTPKGITKQADAIATGSNAQVRSHPAPVLPDTSGRYSHELATLFTSQCLSLPPQPGLWFHLIQQIPDGNCYTLRLRIRQTGALCKVTVGSCSLRLPSRPSGHKDKHPQQIAFSEY
jgi:hypothetical protein